MAVGTAVIYISPLGVQDIQDTTMFTNWSTSRGRPYCKVCLSGGCGNPRQCTPMLMAISGFVQVCVCQSIGAKWVRMWAELLCFGKHFIAVRSIYSRRSYKKPGGASNTKFFVYCRESSTCKH